ncbi:PhzF family phenazine biosynthesis protein [Negadavirga shengliensis]|uniref:PhzF family phenazine biosynthesis protein n=1 Tax=Negadavirga shengliensis TaxID=1389218 RepID=A0ABV9T1B0_9BACT
MSKDLDYTVISVFAAPELGFKGNPAAVIRTEHPLSDNEMQLLANKIQMPATSFIYVDEGGRYQVRWFAPDEEIGLCGHGAAAAGIYLGMEAQRQKTFLLNYKEGQVQVQWMGKNGFRLRLEPIPVIRKIQVPEAIEEGLGIPVIAMWETSNKHLILTDGEKSVREMKPDFETLRKSAVFGYAVTAEGEEADFVSRTLVPHVQQLEDHATGSSHAFLVPFWAEELGKKEMTSYQLSPRGGLFKSVFNETHLDLIGKYTVGKIDAVAGHHGG